MGNLFPASRSSGTGRWSNEGGAGHKPPPKKKEVNIKNWKTLAKAAGLRAVKTVAQTAVATIGTAAVLGAVDWRMVVSASVLAGALSLLTSVAGLPEVKA